MSFGERLSWYRHRLKAMSLREVSHRLVEKWRIWTEGGFLEDIAALDHHDVNPSVPRLPLPEVFSAEIKQQLAKDAKSLLRGEWQIFGWKKVSVGAPPCWHRDPACGVVIDPAIAAHRLNHRHLPDGADARTIWEINRWAEMTRLAMHGWLNHDTDAIRTAQLWLEDWCERNPPGMGINWTSPLEAALRLINFTWFDALVAAAIKGSSAEHTRLAETQSALVKRIVPIHAAWIWRYKSAGSSANNHLLGELAALVVAGQRWPALEKITCPVDHAWSAVSREVLHQFASDGGSREQALHYHLFAFDLAWQAARAVGCRAGDAYDRLCAAGRYFLDLSQGIEAWDFGDNDDAQVVPLTTQRSRAILEWQQWLAGDQGSLKSWLGTTPLTQLHERDLSTPWRTYPDSGVSALRTEGWFLRLDASPLGFGSIAAHGHCDALHLSVWDNQKALLIDPGTGGYYGHAKLRAELASWSAHNGPQPNQGEFKTPRRFGPFLQGSHHVKPVVVVESNTAAARFEHEEHAFQRHVHLLRNGIEIRDTEDQNKPFSVSWCLSPECVVKEVSHTSPAQFEISRDGLHWRLVMESSAASFTISTRRVSPAYAAITEATTITARGVHAGLITRLTRMAT
ncbi:MAG: heparinase II/III family protein [Prosthecobacter sp.]